MFHSNAAFRILETVMNSCAPFSLVHNVNPRHRGTSGFSYKIKFNVTPSSGMMHKSSVWFAWTLLNSPILCKYKPSLEYYVRDRNKVIQGFQWESGTKCNSGWYYVGLMSRLLLQFLAFSSFFSFQKKMFFLTFLYFGKPVCTSAIYTLLRSWGAEMELLEAFCFYFSPRWSVRVAGYRANKPGQSKDDHGIKMQMERKRLGGFLPCLERGCLPCECLGAWPGSAKLSDLEATNVFIFNIQMCLHSTWCRSICWTSLCSQAIQCCTAIYLLQMHVRDFFIVLIIVLLQGAVNTAPHKLSWNHLWG